MQDKPLISAIVPARNEEGVIAACVESLARQPEIGEILVVNDHSADATVAILEKLRPQIPRLRVLDAGPISPAWIGKNYAASRGAAQARLPWLLFTDADSVHLEDSAARALELARESGAALISFSPEQVTKTWWEMALIPYIYCRLAAKFPYDEVNDRNLPAAAANGQYLMIRREAYDAIGGHEGVASEILEDVALARRAKAAGFRLRFSSGKGIVRVRMYRTFRAMWEGWRKNLFLLIGGSSIAVRSELMTTVPWIPSLLLVAGFWWHLLALVGIALLLGRHLAYAAVLARNQFPMSRIFFYVPAILLYVGLLVASYRSHMRGRVEWKGREYAVGAPAAEGERH